MKRSIISSGAGLAFCICLLPSSANAQTSIWSESDWYVGVDIGAALADGEASARGNSIDTFGPTPTVDFDDFELVTGLALGLDTPGPLRTELEYRRRDLSTDGGYLPGTGLRDGDFTSLNGTVDTQTLMLTGYADFNPNGPIQPYLKAGIGAAHNETSSLGEAVLNSDIWSASGLQGETISNIAYNSDTSTDFAWEVGGGLAIPITERATFDLEYQYLDAGDADTGVNGDGDLYQFDDLVSHEATVGLRVKF